MTILKPGRMPGRYQSSACHSELDAPACVTDHGDVTIQIATANSPLHLQAMERPKPSGKMNRRMQRI